MDGAGRVIGAPAMRSEVLAADASLKGAAGSARHRGFSNSAACALAPGRACVVWEKPRGRRGDCRRLLPIYRPTADFNDESGGACILTFRWRLLPADRHGCEVLFA